MHSIPSIAHLETYFPFSVPGVIMTPNACMHACARREVEEERKKKKKKISLRRKKEGKLDDRR